MTATTLGTTSAPALASFGLDASQSAARDAVLAAGQGAPQHVVVHGAPGSGKTRTALAAFCGWLADTPRGPAVLLVPTRRRAATLRDEVARRLDRTTSSVLVRTPASLAFAVLRLRASHLGQPAPTLITGPEQDQVLAELLAGHAAGEGSPIEWPESVPEATRGLRAFRDELRDLLMRAAEAGLDGAELTRWGETHDRPEWSAAGRLLTEYTNVTLLGELTPDRGARYDAATIVDEAVLALRTWEQVVPGVPRPRWDLVVHDDYQDATLATARLLGALADDGTRLALFGDPDTAVQSFRGGVPALLHTATLPPGQVGAWGAAEHVLTHVWRHGGPIREVVGSLTATLPALQETRRRRADHSGEAPARVRTAVVASRAQEVALIARTLREHHVRGGRRWSRMAVIVRSGADIGSVRRGLRTAGVPLTAAAADRPVRDEPAVAPLLLALRAVLWGDVPREACAALLLSPLGGLDAVSLRSLRRVLRQGERAAGGERHSDELLAHVLTDEGAAAGLGPRHRRGPQAVARTLDAGRAALREPGATVETVLWAIWDAAGLSETWQRRALAGGPGAERADADLDAVMALFRAAEQFVDRTPRSTPAAFVEHLDAQDFPADTLAARGQVEEAVAVHTPASAASGEWDLVVVAGVQEDSWPDLRIRDTLLGAADLADIATARHVRLARPADDLDRYRRARREVFDSELRTFVTACSRARQELLVTAVLDVDSRPSAFFTDLTGDDELRPRSVPVPLDLRGLVGELRAAVRPVLAPGGAPTPVDVARASDAAAVLAHLAARDVDGADPRTWGALAGPTSAAPLWASDQTVPVTPSTIETLTTCPLRWALTASGGRPRDSASQNLGNLVHEIAAAHPHAGRDELLAALDARWHELDAPQGWLGRRERDRAERMLGKLADYHGAHPGPVRTEVEFTADLGRVALRGRVDRVEVTVDGAVRVVDLKTGTAPVSREEARRHPQLGAYQAAVAHGALTADDMPAGAPLATGGASLLYVGTSAKAAVQREQVPLHDDEDPQWAQRLLAQSAETMAGATFDARPGPACRTCPVRTSCPVQPEGLRVVPREG